MTRAGVEVGLGVVVRALVLVEHNQPNRRAERDAVLDTRLDPHEVVLVPLRNQSSQERDRQRCQAETEIEAADSGEGSRAR